VIAVLWLGFMTPSGKSGLRDATKRRKRVERVSRPAQQSNQPRIQLRTQQNPWIQADVEAMEQLAAQEAEQPKKVEINRLPDPLSARLGKIENVQWAEVKENMKPEILDEILERRRSNG
jgi:hypothetical protein